MTLQPITSSMLSAIGYDADTLTLYVRFNPSKKQQAAGVILGDLWAYKNIIPERYDEMTKAESIGKWFLANIKGKEAGEVVVPEQAGDVVGRMPDGREIIRTPVNGEARSVPDSVEMNCYQDFDSDDNWGDGPVDGNT